MGQLGFFDADYRLTALSAKGDPLEAIDRLVPWDSFRGDIEAAVLTPETERKSASENRIADASRHEMLHRVGVARAAAVIVTMDSAKAAEGIVTAID